jgi:hypothetical protein
MDVKFAYTLCAQSLTHCSLLRKLTDALAKISFALRSHESMQIRRAAAVGMHASITSWVHLKSSGRSSEGDGAQAMLALQERGLSPYQHLTSLSRVPAREVSGMDALVLNGCLMEYLQWGSTAVTSESDAQCRGVVLENMRLALELVDEK